MELRPSLVRVADTWPCVPGPPTPRPLFLSRAPAGFASPADDFVDKALDLNELCVRHPAATFFVRVEGDSMEGAGIQDGDVLVVDRALEPTDGRVAVVALDGALMVKRLRIRGGHLFLVSENPHYPDLPVADRDLVVWGVVTHVIRAL